MVCFVLCLFRLIDGLFCGFVLCLWFVCVSGEPSFFDGFWFVRVFSLGFFLPSSKHCKMYA